MNKAIVFVLMAEGLITFGQICFKKSANRLTAQYNDQKPWIVHLLKNIFQYPTLWVGAITMLTGMLFWIAALESGELSFVYLLGSIHFILSLFAAHFFLQEKINSTKLIGTLLITLGIVLTALS